MENATKALLMAAGIFITILIISLLVLFYSRISTHYSQKHQFTVIEQSEKFNAQFEAYNKDNIRGNELISFMNKVINYNATESYFDGTGYERIKVTITLGGEDILNQFRYDEEYGKNKYLTTTITNTNGTKDWVDDKNLIAITNTSSDLCNTFNTYNLNDKKLQQLASNISNIVLSQEEEGISGEDDSASNVYKRFKRAELLEDILGISIGSNNTDEIKIDKDTGKLISGGKASNIMKAIKELTSQYYQYMQFKRACFECTEMKYDTNTNRVVEINFKVKITEDGKVVFD